MKNYDIYYNEFNPRMARVLRRLIGKGLIPNGIVDERSIVDIEPEELIGYKQVHMFAGIAGWVYALQLANWPQDIPVWTGSCPCQPFSILNVNRKGTNDEKDLWPVMFKLIRECKPEYVFGEQVKDAIQWGWLDRIYSNMEEINYKTGAVVLSASGVGAPQNRLRLFWLAYSGNRGQYETKPERYTKLDTKELGINARKTSGYFNHWADYDEIRCTDTRIRRIKPGIRLLVDGFPGNVDIMHGLGNAIVPQVAASFINAFMEYINLI